MGRWVWSLVAGTTAGCGLAVLMTWSVAATLGWWLAIELVAVSVCVCLWPDGHRIRWSLLFVRCLPWPTVPLAVGGLVMALGPATAILVTAAGLAAAWEAGWLDGRAHEEWSAKRAAKTERRTRVRDGGRSATVISPRVVDMVDPVDAVLEVTDELTDADLCRAWRSSYVALDRATESNQKLRAVQIRALLLDELGRRDPKGLEAWFRSGARAAGWPDRYLRGGVPPRQPRSTL